MLECNEHSHTHEHHHHSEHKVKNTKITLFVIVLTLLTMVAEIIFGQITNSMALLSDGWHMGTHALALLITFFAYILMEKYSHIFKSGTEKVSDLAGYTSAIFLGVTGIYILIESVKRFINPLQISFSEAVLVAFIGLVVNGICLFIMEFGEHKEKDYNYKAAYLHIAADTLTSVLAIAALLTGKFFGLTFLDPVVGILGGFLIIRWSFGLLSDTTKKLIEYKQI